MVDLRNKRGPGTGILVAAAAFVLLTSLAGCGSTSLLGSSPEPQEAPPPAAEPPPTAPPPIDLAGRWQLSAASGGSCWMTFGEAPHAPASAGAPQGPIAPEGGCPGNFFTSRKWTFEDGALIIRDFKGRPLAHMSYVGGHFEGQDKTGGALTLSRQS